MRRFIFLCGILVCGLPFMASAHLGELSFEKVVDGILVDIGYDVPIAEDRETLLDFGLYRSNDLDEMVGFTTIEYSLHSGSIILTSLRIEKPEFGKAFTVIKPSRGGHWIFKTDFSDGNVVLASASFDVDIEESPRNDLFWLPFGILSACAFCVVAFLFWKRA